MTALLSTSAYAERNMRHVSHAWRIGSKPPRLRTMREFAEQEIVLPAGPFKGKRFRADRQPFAGLAIDAMDSWQGRERLATGPAQSGKSLVFLALPIMYHVFEHNQTVIVGIPDMDMAADKWIIDILPAIQHSRYRDAMPTSGSGSKGGKFELIQFKTGGAIKFMSGKGSDSTRAGFSAPVLFVTEADKMCKAGASSQESNPISQLVARTQAFGPRAVIYYESTVTHEQGFIWENFKNGTATRILTPCAKCKTFVEFTREHLQGWREAENEAEAEARGKFVCPECTHALSEEERTWSNQRGVLVHRGQQITPEGEITGEIAPTQTLAIRWSGFNNLFTTAGVLASKEWRANRASNSDDAEKEMRQIYWCIPYKPPIEDMSALDPHGITRRTTLDRKGAVPDWATILTMGIDVGKHVLHYQVTAWGPLFRGHVVDYGVMPVLSSQMGEEHAVPLALRRINDELVKPGYATSNSDGTPGGPLSPHQVFVDCGWQGKKEQPDFVYDFIHEVNAGVGVNQHRWRPSKGFGFDQYAGTDYRAPLKVEGNTKAIGDHYHMEYVFRGRANWVIHFSSDHWKTHFHNRLSTPMGLAGAMTLYDSPAHKHLELARSYAAEKKVEEFKPGVGNVVKWVKTDKRNHYLDAGVLSAVAAHYMGVRLTDKPKVTVKPAEPRPGIGMPDGRPFLITR